MATDVATPLPDVTLMPGSVVTVDAGTGGTITTLVLHGFQLTPEQRPPARPILVRTDRRSGL